MKLWRAQEREVEVRRDKFIIETIQAMLRKISGFSNETDAARDELEKLRLKRHDEFVKLVRLTDIFGEEEVGELE